MRIAALGLLLAAMVASTAQAGFIESVPITSASVPGFAGSTFKFAVYQSSTAPGNISILNAPVVATNDYLYMYQLKGATAAALPKFTQFSTSAAGAKPGEIGFFTHPLGGTVDPTSASFTGGDALFQFNPQLGGSSTVMYFVSTFAPSLNGTAYFSGLNGANGFVGAAVPVPVPPALALLLAGAPFAEFIRRRSRRA